MMNRGMDRGRGLGINEAFFMIHVRTSKSTRPFKFGTNSASISLSSFRKANSKRSVDFEEYTHPAQQPTPLKMLDLCGSWRFWAQMVNMCTPNPRCGVIPPPIPLSPPLPPPPHPPPSSPPPPLPSSQRLFSRDSIFKCLWGPGIVKE